MRPPPVSRPVRVPGRPSSLVLLPPRARDGQPSVTAEVLQGDLRPRRVLAALVLRAVDQPDHPLDERRVVAQREQLVAAFVPLHVLVEQPGEDGVRRGPGRGAPTPGAPPPRRAFGELPRGWARPPPAA